VRTRAEQVLSKINHGHAITFASGIAAGFAGLMFYEPKCIAITEGYHGFYKTLDIYRNLRGAENVKVIGINDEFPEGTLCWVETPLNPSGESRNIQYYADKVHAVGGKLVIDSTFDPPPLQYPFKWGADMVMHSGTKYFGGHSDLLAGVLIVKTTQDWASLFHIRTYTGNTPGSLEAWLLLRSLRTLHLRVPRQSENAAALAGWLNAAAKVGADGIPSGTIDSVSHSSLQGAKVGGDGWCTGKQMEGGWNATFSIRMAKAEYASLLPYALKYFVPATSLGGVESLIEHKASTGDLEADPKVLRLSIGVEDIEDLKEDFRRAIKIVVSKAQGKL